VASLVGRENVMGGAFLKDEYGEPIVNSELELIFRLLEQLGWL